MCTVLGGRVPGLLHRLQSEIYWKICVGICLSIKQTHSPGPSLIKRLENKGAGRWEVRRYG
jgi:hypothetical protein